MPNSPQPAFTESSLRFIADTLPAYVAYIGHDMRYVMVNRTYVEQFNRTEDQIVGHHVADVLGPSYINVQPHLEAALSGVAQHFETRMETVHGTRFLAVAHVPEFDPDGRVRGIVVHGLDITDRRRAEAALIQNEKLAAVGRLASSIAHEINNPLESVVNLVYLIEQCAEQDPAAAKQYATIAQQELARVSQIATQTLRFFHQSTAATLTDIGLLAEAVLALYQARLNNAAITARLRIRPQSSILCFEGEIRQVLNNLVANAIDAMKDQASQSTLSIRVTPATDYASNRPGIRVTVADTGTGMSPATAAHIFEPFFTTKGISGTGLGLWISSGLLTKHHGSFAVRSSTSPERHGTVVTFFLPHPKP